MRVFLIALVTALAVLTPATAGASNVTTDKQIRKELLKACDTAYDLATKAPPRTIVRQCNRYYKCLRNHLGLKKIRAMHAGLRAGQDQYPYKPFNEACLETHMPK